MFQIDVSMFFIFISFQISCFEVAHFDLQKHGALKVGHQISKIQISFSHPFSFISWFCFFLFCFFVVLFVALCVGRFLCLMFGLHFVLLMVLLISYFLLLVY
jgi:hypothetical protein